MKLWRRIAMKNGKGSGNSIRRMMRSNQGAKISITDNGSMRFGGSGVPTLLESLFKRAGLTPQPSTTQITDAVTQSTLDVQDVEVKEPQSA